MEWLPSRLLPRATYGKASTTIGSASVPAPGRASATDASNRTARVTLDTRLIIRSAGTPHAPDSKDGLANAASWCAWRSARRPGRRRGDGAHAGRVRDRLRRSAVASGAGAGRAALRRSCAVGARALADGAGRRLALYRRGGVGRAVRAAVRR